MALFDFSKTTENHYHGAAPNLVVNGDEGNISDNTINTKKALASSPSTSTSTSTSFEIFKILFTQALTLLGGIALAYIVYLFGLSGKPISMECYFPVRDNIKNEVNMSKRNLEPLPSLRLTN